MEIYLQFYDDSFEDKINSYQLTKEQLKHTASPLKALDRAKKECNHFPVLILDRENNPVGFFVLNVHQTTYTEVENKNAILLRSFSVDSRFTGKGIGTQAMKLVTQFVKNNFPFVDEIILGVNENNQVARKIYISIGCKPTGIRFFGRSGWQDILSLSLL